ncbi:MAG: roadblock/LC7 domain-containing protein [Planctomycetota bacterium]|jgi:predicted regulator of Ras-like GTPase activity (Roadblock/LC7/MglB family)
MSQDERFEQKMKKNRLVFYENDINEIDIVLEKFIEASQAKCVLLVDLEGHLVTKKGFTDELDTTSISALIAGSFASTRAVAKKLGEAEFSVLFHQGVNENIHISLVADRALIVIIFDDRTTIGMVRLYAEQVSDGLKDILVAISEREDDGKGEKLSEEFADEAESQLDDFFGESEE